MQDPVRHQVGGRGQDRLVSHETLSVSSSGSRADPNIRGGLVPDAIGEAQKLLDYLKGDRMIPDQVPAIKANLEQMMKQKELEDEIAMIAQLEETKRILFREEMVESLKKIPSIVERRREEIEQQIRRQEGGASSSAGPSGEGGASSSTAPRRGRPPSQRPQERQRSPREKRAVSAEARTSTSGSYIDNNTSKSYWKQKERSIGYIHDQLDKRGIRFVEELKHKKDPKTNKTLIADRKGDLLILVNELIDKKQWVRELGT
jgi:hypothetical protein